MIMEQTGRIFLQIFLNDFWYFLNLFDFFYFFNLKDEIHRQENCFARICSCLGRGPTGKARIHALLWANVKRQYEPKEPEDHRSERAPKYNDPQLMKPLDFKYFRVSWGWNISMWTVIDHVRALLLFWNLECWYILCSCHGNGLNVMTVCIYLLP